MALTRQQMRGHPPVPERPVDPDADTVVDAPIVAAEPEAAESAAEPNQDDDKLPDHVTENADGSWNYHLQWPLEPSKVDPEGTDISVVHIPTRVFVRHVLAASKKGVDTAVEEQFHTLCAACGVLEDVMKRVDQLDYAAITNAFYKLRLRTMRRRASPPNPNPA